MGTKKQFVIVYRQSGSDSAAFDIDLIERRLNLNDGDYVYRNWQAAAIVHFQQKDAELEPGDLMGSWLKCSPSGSPPKKYVALTADDCLTRKDLQDYPITFTRLS